MNSFICMNWINRHSRADGSCTVGSCRINRFLFADDMVLLEPLNKASINTHFADACDQVRLKINNKRPMYYVTPETQGSVRYK